MKRALFSLYKKDGCENFAKFLESKGYEIISTGGTYKYLKEKSIKVKEISEITGFPEILDGRVKTLHPIIHGGILAIRNNKNHIEQLNNLNIIPIDFVVVNLYPFEETISNPNSTYQEIIEQIDIGGVTLIRAAAKNYQDTVIIVDNEDFDWIIKEFEEKGNISLESRKILASKAFCHTSYYDSLIAYYFNREINQKFPKEYGIPLKFYNKLRYGENPHQEAMLYKSGIEKNISLLNSKILWGKEMSYNNYLDADACIDILREFSDSSPVCIIIKHTNPCGAAMADTLYEAYEKAFKSDPVSAFGGIVGFNNIVDKNLADKLVETFFEIIIAPDYNTDALEVLKTKKNLRIIKLESNDWKKKGLNYRRIEGGFLAQNFDEIFEDINNWKVVTENKPDQKIMEDLVFAWKIAKHVKSNAIVYVSGKRTIGVGAGQMSRIDSARIGVIKANEFGFNLKGAVMASDAFFPFRDTVDFAAQNGIVAIIQPGGSLRDEESIKAANEHGISMIFTGIRHFKH